MDKEFEKVALIGSGVIFFICICIPLYINKKNEQHVEEKRIETVKKAEMEVKTTSLGMQSLKWDREKLERERKTFQECIDILEKFVDKDLNTTDDIIIRELANRIWYESDFCITILTNEEFWDKEKVEDLKYSSHGYKFTEDFIEDLERVKKDYKKHYIEKMNKIENEYRDRMAFIAEDKNG